jgi:hypothetical protein
MPSNAVSADFEAERDTGPMFGRRIILPLPGEIILPPTIRYGKAPAANDRATQQKPGEW